MFIIILKYFDKIKNYKIINLNLLIIIKKIYLYFYNIKHYV